MWIDTAPFAAAGNSNTALRDLFCLLPSWPVHRVLELAPLNWKKTLQDEDTQQRLDANVFRRVTLGLLGNHSPTK